MIYSTLWWLPGRKPSVGWYRQTKCTRNVSLSVYRQSSAQPPRTHVNDASSITKTCRQWQKKGFPLFFQLHHSHFIYTNHHQNGIKVIINSISCRCLSDSFRFQRVCNHQSHRKFVCTKVATTGIWRILGTSRNIRQLWKMRFLLCHETRRLGTRQRTVRYFSEWRSCCSLENDGMIISFFSSLFSLHVCFPPFPQYFVSCDTETQQQK